MTFTIDTVISSETLQGASLREAAFADSRSIILGDETLCQLFAAAGIGADTIDDIAGFMTAQSTGDRSFLPVLPKGLRRERRKAHTRTAKETRYHVTARQMIAADRALVRKARRADLGWEELAPLVDHVAAGLAAKESNARARPH